MDQRSDSKAIFQYAPAQTMLLFAFTNINGLVLITTEHTRQTKVCSVLYQSNTATSKHTELSDNCKLHEIPILKFHLIPLKKTPKLNQSVPIFKRIDLFK